MRQAAGVEVLSYGAHGSSCTSVVLHDGVERGREVRGPSDW